MLSLSKHERPDMESFLSAIRKEAETVIDIFLGPKQYVQREGVLAEAENHLKVFGRRPLILADELVLGIVRPILERRLQDAGLASSFVLFGGECCESEISSLKRVVQAQKLDFIIGAGGGKALDTARLVAFDERLPLVTIPTSAATCAAASDVAVVYENGIRQRSVTGKPADLCLVDSGIISRAPARLLASGMADALAKWYEGKPCCDHLEDPDSAALSAMILAEAMKDKILADGLKAMRDVEAGKHTPAVEAMIENNILITGVIGCLAGGKIRIALAHALLYGMGVIPGIHEQLHGEVVGYGMIVQLCLEKNEEGLQAVLPFLAKAGLPMTLAEIGIHNMEDPLFREGLKRTCEKGSPVEKLPFPVDEKRICQAIIDADARAAKVRRKSA